MPRRVLAIAAATGRVGYVFLEKKDLRDWALSRKASAQPELAAAHAKAWIDQLRPDAVVTEKITKRCRKGEKTRKLIGAIAATAANEYLYDVSVELPRTHPNKYAEAASLAERFPELKPWASKSRELWDSEPRSMIYFEALALALAVCERVENAGRETG